MNNVELRDFHKKELSNLKKNPKYVKLAKKNRSQYDLKKFNKFKNKIAFHEEIIKDLNSKISPPKVKILDEKMSDKHPENPITKRRLDVKPATRDNRNPHSRVNMTQVNTIEPRPELSDSDLDLLF